MNIARVVASPARRARIVVRRSEVAATMSGSGRLIRSSFAAVVAVLLLVATTAALIPAIRATCISPIDAIRTDG